MASLPDDPSRKDLTVYRAMRDGTTILARGSLDSCPGRIESVACDGERIVVTCSVSESRFVFGGSIVHGTLGGLRRLTGPRQAGAVAAGRRGAFYVGSLAGDLSRALPTFWEERSTPAGVANDRGELKVTDDGRHLILRVTDANGTDAYADFTVGDVVDGRPLEEARGGQSEYSDPWTDAVYLPEAREVWTFDGTPDVAVWTVVAGRREPKRVGTMRVEGGAVRAARLGPSRWLLARSDGTLTVGEAHGHRWQWVARARLFPSFGYESHLWATQDHRTAFVSFPLVGELWSISLGPGPSGMRATRLTHTGSPSLISFFTGT